MPWRHMGDWRCSSTILNLGARWRWVVTFRPAAIFPGKRVPGTYWVEGWVGLRACLNTVEKRREEVFPYRKLNPSCSTRSLLLYWLSYAGSQVMSRKSIFVVLYQCHEPLDLILTYIYSFLLDVKKFWSSLQTFV
jgi:hypothetical protein